MNELSKEQSSQQFRDCLKNLNPEELTLWSELMAQFRQVHSDTWNGVRFFLAINVVILASIFTIISGSLTPKLSLIVALLALIGLGGTVTALRIFSRHRKYYISILLRKTLIEKEMGFYDTCLSETDLSFPWKVDREYVESLCENPKKWLSDQKWRKGTISRMLKGTYQFVGFIYVIILIVIVISWCMGWLSINPVGG